MDYDTVLEQVLALLQREKRLAYRVLKRRFQLDDDLLEDLKGWFTEGFDTADLQEARALLDELS